MPASLIMKFGRVVGRPASTFKERKHFFIESKQQSDNFIYYLTLASVARYTPFGTSALTRWGQNEKGTD
jgi:hypothetical protein